MKITPEITNIANSKLIDKDKPILVHFTDITFLDSILSQGINKSEASMHHFRDLKHVCGGGYGIALDNYRSTYRERHEDRINFLNNYMTNQRDFIISLIDNTLNEQEQEIIKPIIVEVNKDDKYLEKMERSKFDLMFEMYARTMARSVYTTLNRDATNSKSAMNVALLFDFDAMANTDEFNVFFGSPFIKLHEKSSIKGYVVYEVNLNETIDIMLNNVKTKEDIAPIYNYNTDVIWPIIK